MTLVADVIHMRFKPGVKTYIAQFFHYLDEQVEAWPLPQGLSHSAQTHCGSSGFENAGIVAMAKTEITASVITIG
jgi:hypothetical protein